MRNSIFHANAPKAYFPRIVVSLMLMIAAASRSEEGPAPAKAGAASHSGLFSSARSQPPNLYFEFPQATPTAFPDEMRFAIIAHALDCVDEDGGMHFFGDGTGSLEMYIFNGSIFSNACMEAGGGIEAVLVSETSRAYFVTEYHTHGNAEIIPTPMPFPNPIDISFLGVPQPDCSQLPWYGDHSGGGVIEPGVYDSITIASGTILMKPGLYCVLGDVALLGGKVAAIGVTLFVEGDFTSTSSADVYMHAPQQRVPPQLGIADVLLYMGEGSSARLYTKEDEGFSGMVYAPGESTEIVLAGFGLITTQLVAHTVKITPYADLDLVLDPLHSYPKEVLDE